MANAVADHLLSCQGFTDVVGQVANGWDRPSPCPGWDAQAILEHVIGFHDVLLLVPLGAKPRRPKGDPAARWAVTWSALGSALREDRDRGNPAISGSRLGLARLLPALTTEVLVHTWDLAKAIGVIVELDAELCEHAYQTAQRNVDRLRASGMFTTPIPVGDDVDNATKLVAFLGRDPAWPR